MFQDFTTRAEPGRAGDRVKAVRALMAALDLDALLVPRADRHQGEYVAAASERLAWLTGFTGSAGAAVIGQRKAVLFADGRYTVQARSQVDGRIFELRQSPAQTISQWLKETLPAGARVGFDPWLHTIGEIARLREATARHRLELVPVARRNLVDRAWGEERPTEPAGPIFPHPLKYAGTPAAEKIAAIQKRLATDGQDAVVLTLPDSIAWAFNIRGQDVAHNPVVLAFAIVPASGKAELFVDAARLRPEARAQVAKDVKVAAPRSFRQRLGQLRKARKRVRLDPDTAAFQLARWLGPRRIARGRDPAVDLKARKSAAEIRGARAAHERDGIALARFLAWIDANARKGRLDEIAAVRELEALRQATGLLRDISFDTISGSGPNGAIVHYRVTEASNRILRSGELFLIDSGAQYADGTTDVTRTVAIGRPSEEMRERYTAVLKGHIAISTARFPKGTRGIDLDPLARRPLWELGLDYDHGTGHGVGSYLSVHEGPASISRRGMAELEPGMILSNEPGYYKTGAYGIRIENLVLVGEAQVPSGGERHMMGFETLTLVPYDRRLIVARQLSEGERAWVDAYHKRVRERIGPKLDRAARSWLNAATAPLQ